MDQIVKTQPCFNLFYNTNNTMGTICICQSRNIELFDQSLPIVLQSPKKTQSKIEVTPTEMQDPKPQIDSIYQRQQSELKINASKISKSEKLSSITRQGLPNHKLLIVPPSEHDSQKMRALQNMSQVPSDFFNNCNMSAYFNAGKSQIDSVSQKYSFKKGRIDEKRSIQQDYFEVQNKNNLSKDTNNKLPINLSQVRDQRISRSQIKKSGSTTYGSDEMLKTASRSVLESGKTSTFFGSLFRTNKLSSKDS